MKALTIDTENMEDLRSRFPKQNRCGSHPDSNVQGDGRQSLERRKYYEYA